MAKYGTKVFASDIVNTKKHWAVGTVWTAKGSKGIYHIEMKDIAFTC